MYIVINYFTDLQDNSHPYKVGDVYPRKGLSVNADRIKELSSNKNKQGKALIKAVEVEETPKVEVAETPKVEETAETETTTVSYTKTDINRMSKDTLVAIATKNGIDTTDKSGGELKKALIEYFKLD